MQLQGVAESLQEGIFPLKKKRGGPLDELRDLARGRDLPPMVGANHVSREKGGNLFWAGRILE